MSRERMGLDGFDLIRTHPKRKRKRAGKKPTESFKALTYVQMNG